MAKKKPYTQEQILELQKNMYTHSVTPNRIVFTLEFKQFFLDQVKNHNKTSAQAITEAGYDISYFSTEGIHSIRKQILSEANSDTGLRPPRGLSQEQKTAAFEAKDLSKQKTEKSIEELQQRIVKLEKQVEFLKKISFLKK